MAEKIALTRRAILFLPLALAACKPGSTVHKLTGSTMGTTYSVVAVDPGTVVPEADIRAAINGALAQVNSQMSNWDPNSEVSRFNAARTTDPISVSAGMSDVMRAAQNVNAACLGCFDVTVGPLIDLWGFGAAKGASSMPSAEAVAAARAVTGQDKLFVSAGALQKSVPESEIYLSAIGKGHGVDLVAKTVASLGLEDFMVEIGGDLYTQGRNADGMPWQIGIESPDMLSRQVQKVVGVSGLGMATSGDYRNYFDQDGQRYSHIIDPATGRPIIHKTASATVLTENAMLADAWATGMLTLGSEKGLAVAEAQDLAVIFVDRADGDFVIKESPAFRRLSA
ncbi:MAG: FAD:protein FMN transferase [Pseudomonadota bacterium]